MYLLQSFDIYFLIICVIYGGVLIFKDYRLAKVEEDIAYAKSSKNFGIGLIIVGILLYIIGIIFI